MDSGRSHDQDTNRHWYVHREKVCERERCGRGKHESFDLYKSHFLMWIRGFAYWLMFSPRRRHNAVVDSIDTARLENP